MQKKIRTVLVLLPFLAVMCRCATGGMIVPGEGAYPGIDGMRCSDLMEYFGEEGDSNLKAREVLECTLTCPGTGKVVKMDFYAPEGELEPHRGLPKPINRSSKSIVPQPALPPQNRPPPLKYSPPLPLRKPGHRSLPKH